MYRKQGRERKVKVEMKKGRGRRYQRKGKAEK